MSGAVPCKACGESSGPDHTVRIRSHDAALYRCPACGLFFFPDPIWLDAAYADPISEVDVGLPSRCLNLARITEALVRAEGLGDRVHLDYGGGYGLMTRFVRDRGIDMRHHDPYAKNLFAQGLEGSLDRDYGCITVVEVLEHVTDPVQVVTGLARWTDLIVAATILTPDGMSDLSGWWYLLPDLGQHITFYSEAAMRAIAAEAGLMFTTNHVGVHVFHRRPLRRLSRLILQDVRLSPTIGTVLRRRDRASSLRESDGAQVMELMSRKRAGDSSTP